MEINKYKRINVQTLQSQVQDSVENEETHEETQGQANHESREASAPGFAAPDPSTGPEAPPEEVLPIPIWRPFEDKPIDECNDVNQPHNIRRFKCKTCQIIFIDNNLLIHHRKREYSSNSVCKYFLTHMKKKQQPGSTMLVQT